MTQMIARAQAARQKPENPRVGGSIPPLATIFLRSVCGAFDEAPESTKSYPIAW
jgi:hypothetical protein